MISRIHVILVSTCLICLLVLVNSGNVHFGPDLEDHHMTTCKEFSQFARFNPFSVVGDIWVVFYYWGPAIGIKVYSFSIPSTRALKLLQTYLNDTVVSHPVNWTNTVLVMKNKVLNYSALLVQMDDRGLFLRYTITKKLKKGALIYPSVLNFKQVDNGKYIAYMDCVENTAYMLSRPYDIPRKMKIQDEVAKIKFIGRKGKSYLYQGHEWMPIPERDDYDPQLFYKYK